MPIIRSPGKFEGELDLCKALYELTLDGGADEEAEEDGWFGLMTGLKFSEILSDDDSPALKKKLKADFGDVSHNGMVNVIIHERTDGFVECSFYDTAQRAKKDFDRIESERIEEDEPFEGLSGRKFSSACSSLNGRRHC